MGMTATVIYKRLASLITEKYEKPYSKTMRVELLTAALGHHVLAWIQVLMTQPDPIGLACSKAAFKARTED